MFSYSVMFRFRVNVIEEFYLSLWMLLCLYIFFFYCYGEYVYVWPQNQNRVIVRWYVNVPLLLYLELQTSPPSSPWFVGKCTELYTNITHSLSSQPQSQNHADPASFFIITIAGADDGPAIAAGNTTKPVSVILLDLNQGRSNFNPVTVLWQDTSK